jgi:hypothetical protein
LKAFVCHFLFPLPLLSQPNISPPYPLYLVTFKNSELQVHWYCARAHVHAHAHTHTHILCTYTHTMHVHTHYARTLYKHAYTRARSDSDRDREMQEVKYNSHKTTKPLHIFRNIVYSRLSEVIVVRGGGEHEYLRNTGNPKLVLYWATNRK